MHKKVVVFDLDDTLYKEVDFLKSAYREIAKLCSSKNSTDFYKMMISDYYAGENVFERITEKTDKYSVDDLVNIYRQHYPTISLSEGAADLINFIKKLNHRIGIITDGRSKQQRNKLKALSLSETFNDIVISEEFKSEKPSELNYMHFQNKYLNSKFYYIGDNFKKDFLMPNKLGWSTIALLDDGRNIHKQNHNLPPDYLPTDFVNSLSEIKSIISS